MPEIKEGDMVLTKDGRMGLCVGTNPKLSGVQFVQNGRVSNFKTRNLRRATLKEVMASSLDGVGCNQAYDDMRP